MICALIAAAIIVAACSKNPANAGGEIQLIMNSNIEEGQYQPAYWSFSTNPRSTNLTYSSDWSTNESHSPSHSLKIGLDSWQEDPAAYAYWYQFIYPYPDRFAGQKMKLELYFKLDGVSGGGIEILLSALKDVETVTSVRKGPFFGTSNWQSVTASIESIPSGIETIIVYLIFGSSTSGTVYFDDITLTVKE